LAETLNFSKAAALLNISHPPSRAIQKLKEEMRGLSSLQPIGAMRPLHASHHGAA
jgi:hypothetical protein